MQRLTTLVASAAVSRLPDAKAAIGRYSSSSSVGGAAGGRGGGINNVTPGGAVVLRAEPEFEGEAPAVGRAEAAGSAQAVTTAAATPAKLPLGYVPPHRSIPVATGVIRKLRPDDFDEIGRVYDAYCAYFNHMRFRQGWESPRYDKEKCKENWMGAAEYVVRIRHILDEQVPGQKLRMKDGAAQEFLHSETAKKLGDGTSFEFLVALVHATMRDAVGYVEGLNRAKVDELVRAISEYRFNPKVHSLHMLAEIEGVVQRAVMKDDTAEAVAEAEQNPTGAWMKRYDDFYIAANGAADKAWREGIRGLYDALDHLGKAERFMRGTLVEKKPPTK